MAASINYKTFYTGVLGDPVQKPSVASGLFGTAADWQTGASNAERIIPTLDSGPNTENSSLNKSRGQTVNNGDIGGGYVTKTIATVPSNTIWSIEKFNIVFNREYLISNQYSNFPSNWADLSYASPTLNFDMFSVVLQRGGTTAIELVSDYFLQPNVASEKVAAAPSSSAPNNLWTQALSLSERTSIQTSPTLNPGTTGISDLPNLYQFNLEAGDILQFQYAFKYRAPQQGSSWPNFLNTTTSIRYTPKWNIFLSGIEHVTA